MKQKQRNNNKTIGFWLLNQNCCTEREATILRHCHPCHGCLDRKASSSISLHWTAIKKGNWSQQSRRFTKSGLLLNLKCRTE
jgi:hypothetical protein